MLLYERMETATTYKLLHATPVKNRANILENGLLSSMAPSGYGKVPTKKAVYLYHRNNIDVPADLIDIFKEIDIWEVTVDISKLSADEDSGAKRYNTSLEKMGTCAHMGNIPSNKIKLIGTAKNINDIKRLQSIEDY